MYVKCIKLKHSNFYNIIFFDVSALPGDTVDYKNEEKKIPEGHMWIEGDCKSQSLDSREYGPVPIGLMLGKVYWKIPWFSQNLFTVKTD